MADWTWSSPKPPGKDLFFHKFSPKQPYSVQVFNLNKIPFADGKVSSFISHNKLHWPHPLFPSTWMLWTLSYKTSVTTSPEYFTLWLASGIDCDFWNRGLLFFAALHLLLCSTPIAGCISPSVLSSQWLTGQTQARMNTGFFLWTRWAIKLNQAVTHNTNHSYRGLNSRNRRETGILHTLVSKYWCIFATPPFLWPCLHLHTWWLSFPAENLCHDVSKIVLQKESQMNCPQRCAWQKQQHWYCQC